MKDLKEYVIPVAKLSDGVHTCDFEIDWQFFSHFEESPLEQGRFTAHVDFVKHPDHWLAVFKIAGHMDTACDRCLAQISLPVNGEFSVVVKYEEERSLEVVDDSDVIYVPRDTHNWEVAQLLYEFVLLSLPVQKVYDCEAEELPPCDQEALSKLEDEDQDIESDSDSIWDALKDIELNN